MRNKNLLSDKEKNRMTADIVENVKDCKVDLKYTNGEEGWTYSNANNEWSISKHEVMIGKIKGIEQFTLLNHELGHIMFDSPIVSATDMITQWAEAWDMQYKEDSIFKLYWSALNLLEDERIESLMGRLWLKNNERFLKAKKNVGKGLDNELKVEKDLKSSPIQTLLGVRFFRDDVVKKDDVYNLTKQLLDDVKTVSPHGVLVCLRLLKPHIDMWLRDMIDKEEKLKDKLQDNITKAATTPSKSDNALNTEHDKLKTKIQENKEALKKGTTNKRSDTQFREDQSVRVDTDDLKEKENKGENITEQALKDSLEHDKKEGKEIIQEMKDMLSTGTPRGKEEIVEDNGVRSIGARGRPFEGIADGMNKIFKKMSEIPKTIIGYEGDEVDIEAYTEGKIRRDGIGECLIDERYTRGASVLLSVDASCSMNNNRGSMTTARNLVATLYRSIQGVDNVNLKCILWSSNKEGEMSITDVDSLKQTNRMYVTREYCLTPTHMAIKYSVSAMKKMKGRKKLLILITDGYPRYYHLRKRIMTNVLVKMARKALLRGLRKCPNIMVMLITPTPSSREYSKEIFGKRLMIVNDMADGSEVIVKRFKRLVMEVLR